MFKKEKIIKSADNIYTVLNDELKRMHNMAKQHDGNESNVQTIWNKIKEIQDALLASLKRNPMDQETIKDLQDSVADLYLTGTESNDK